MKNNDTFGSGMPDGFSEPEGMSAMEKAELALMDVARKHTKTRHHDAWCVKPWKEEGAK